MNPELRRLEEALIEVFREQRPRLWGFFTRGAGASGTAEDLLQETFLRAWDHRDRLGEGPSGDSADERAPHDAIRRYLWRVARNLMIDEIRLRHRRGASELDDSGLAGSSPGPAEEVELEECRRVVRETISRLPNERGRRCLELWLEEKDLEAIARDVGLGMNQVRGLLQRARAELVARAADRFHVRPAPAGEESERTE